MPDKESDHKSKRSSALPSGTKEIALEIWAEQAVQSRIRITGNSMRPAIRSGDHVRVRHGAGGIRQGDVVVFRYGDDLAAHRVLRVWGDARSPTLLTKGDNARHPDGHINAEQIVGRAVAVERDSRCMRLDTRAQRAVGGWIAITALVWLKMSDRAHTLKQRLIGSRHSRLTAALRRGSRRVFSLIARTVPLAFARWQDSPSAEKEQ